MFKFLYFRILNYLIKLGSILKLQNQFYHLNFLQNLKTIHHLINFNFVLKNYFQTNCYLI
jgi:hypothetical protein